MPVLLALSAAVSWGTADFLGGFASRRSGKVNAVAIAIQFAGLVSIALLAPFIGGRLTVADFVWSFLAGIGAGLALFSMYTGFTKSHTGVVAPIAAIGTGVIPVLFGLATGDRLTGYQAIGVPLGLIAVWMVSRPDSRAALGDYQSGAGFIYGVAAGFGYGFMFIALDQLTAESGAWGAVPVRGGGLLTVLVITGFRKLPMVPVGRVWPMILGSGLLGSMGNLAFIIAARLGDLTIVAVVSSLFPAATVILAYLFLHERLGRLQRVGVVAALVAVALVSAG
jgi:drug/metabolite transporter (DMT)-like permease